MITTWFLLNSFYFIYFNCLQCHSDQPKLKRQSYSYKQDVFVNIGSLYRKKITFYAGVFYQLQYVIHFKSTPVTSFQHFRKCNQQQPDMSFAYKKNCNHCIWLVTR